MLNELRDLARSLNKAGISQEDWHSKFKTCPKYTAFSIYPSVEGEIVKIEPVVDNGLGDIRKWEPNNGESFPVFNIPPLYSVPEPIRNKVKEIEKGANINEADIRETIKNCTCLWDEQSKIGKNIKTKVEKSLHNITSSVDKMLSDEPAELRAIKVLIAHAKKIDFGKLRENLKELAVHGVAAGRKEFFDILFTFQKPDDDKPIKQIQLLLELINWDQAGYEYPANHINVQRWMNRKFLEHEKRNQGNAQLSADAYGEDATGTDEQKYPEVKLPVLGQVKLRSMFKDIPAQTRYRMIEAGSFPTGDKVRKDMKSALEWVSAADRKSKTWSDLSAKTDKASLLFAYPAEMTDALPELAGLLGGTDDNLKDPDGVRFSAIAQRVTDALKGIANDRPDSEIRIFVLAKMDKARTKVMASRRYTANHMIDAAMHWQEGCNNIPAIRIRQFGKEKGQALWVEPLVPFPSELVWCLNTAWRIKQEKSFKKGEEKAVHGYSMNDALSLLLDAGPEPKRLALRAIGSIVMNSSPLILAVGHENHSEKPLKVNQKYAKQSLLLPSILGLLLYKIDMKGGYMTSPAFLVGRFLSLTDKLHLKYCEHVRKNSIPPQLVGNAMMPTALEEPVKALSMLSQRILPYQAWANTLKEGEEVGLIKYFLKELGDVSDKLRELDIPKQSTEADKAQMLLGYLAWSEKAND